MVGPLFGSYVFEDYVDLTMLKQKRTLSQLLQSKRKVRGFISFGALSLFRFAEQT